MARNAKRSRYFGMTRIQLLIVSFLGVLVLCLVSILVLLLTKNTLFVQTQYQPQIQKPSTIIARINLSISQSTDNRIVINGSTNLPDETIIMVSITGDASDYLAQDRVVVSNGKFKTGSFSSGGYGLDGGKYTVEALMPYPKIQPDSVRKIIGDNGEMLSGNQVVLDNGVLVVATKGFTIIIPTPSPLPLPTATVTPITTMLSGGDIGRNWFNEEHRISLLSVYRTESLDGIKPFGERLGGYRGGYTQFLVVELQFERFTEGYDEYDLTDFWLGAYSGDYLEYGADQYLYDSSRTIRVYYQEKTPVTFAFEVRPDSHNFIMCYQTSVGLDFSSGKIVSECGSFGYQFKFGD